MKIVLAAAFALLASSAAAAPPGQPAPVDPNKPVTITLPLSQWNKILYDANAWELKMRNDEVQVLNGVVGQVNAQIASEPKK